MRQRSVTLRLSVLLPRLVRRRQSQLQHIRRIRGHAHFHAHAVRVDLHRLCVYHRRHAQSPHLHGTRHMWLCILSQAALGLACASSILYTRAVAIRCPLSLGTATRTGTCGESSVAAAAELCGGWLASQELRNTDTLLLANRCRTALSSEWIVAKAAIVSPSRRCAREGGGVHSTSYLQS